MANDLLLEHHKDLLSYISLIFNGEDNLFAKMANTTAILKNHTRDWIWIGFYMVDSIKLNQLVLGPFQGDTSSFRETYNQGVLGKAWSMQKPIIIHDIGDFASELSIPKGSRSQIALPLFQNNRIIAIFSIYSKEPQSFSEEDKNCFEKIMELLVQV